MSSSSLERKRQGRILPAIDLIVDKVPANYRISGRPLPKATD